MKPFVLIVLIIQCHLFTFGQVRIKVVDAGTNLGMEDVEVIRKGKRGKIKERKLTNSDGIVEFKKNSGLVTISKKTKEYSHFPFELLRKDKHEELVYFMYPSGFLPESENKKNNKKSKPKSSKETIREVIIVEEDDDLDSLLSSSEDYIIDDYPDVEAEFPGGTDAMIAFLAKTIQYPRYAMEMGDKGKVFVEFVVERDGSLTQIKILRGVSKAIDYETVRVIKNMPAWSPAESKGEIVRARCRVPINYILE